LVKLLNKDNWSLLTSDLDDVVQTGAALFIFYFNQKISKKF